jgi:hypothetical protein
MRGYWRGEYENNNLLGHKYYNERGAAVVLLMDWALGGHFFEEGVRKL